MRVHGFVFSALFGSFFFIWPESRPVHAAAAVSASGSISGRIVHKKTKKPIEGALVILQCTGLQDEREATTGADGLYALRDLPPGRCTVQAIAGEANAAKIVTLPAKAMMRANFAVDPNSNFTRIVTVESNTVRSGPSAPGVALDMRQAKNLPAGRSTGRDFTGIVDLKPTAETYRHTPLRRRKSVRRDPISTFSVDVDTGSFSNVRRMLLDERRLPPADAVRLEEFVNYFDYAVPTMAPGEDVGVDVEVTACPWDADKRLARVVVGARAIEAAQRPPLNLVFLIDVSGSMDSELKLGLIQDTLPEFVATLGRQDRVSIVVYAGHSGVLVEGVRGDRHALINAEIARLQSGGSTHGSAGLRDAYRIAHANARPGSVSRVVLMTDGDFNVGVTGHEPLMAMIEEHRGRGVYLNTLGFGMGNYKDGTMEQLADRGDGNYAYIDTEQEARRVVERAMQTLVPMAKDVKVQVEFNAKAVSKYRLLGYENRVLREQDFDDDRRDAGDMGAGQVVTALYELTPTRTLRRRRYERRRRRHRRTTQDEMLFVQVRYKPNGSEESRYLAKPVADTFVPWYQASPEQRFVVAVAQFAMVLRGDSPRGVGLSEVLRNVNVARRTRRHRTDDEFVEMVQVGRELRRE